MRLVPCLLLLCILLSGCSAPSTTTQTPASPVEAKRITSTGVVHASATAVELSAQRTGESIVTLKIDSGYHINANPPTYPYLKATELVVTPRDGYSASGVTYPEAITKKFPFAEKPLAVYEGDTKLKVSMTADSEAPRGDHSVTAVLKVQACDEQVCYPPGQIDLNIPVSRK